jgi:hypothetical protein
VRDPVPVERAARSCLDREAALLHRAENTHRAVDGVELLVDVAGDLRDEPDTQKVDCHEQQMISVATLRAAEGIH